MARPKSDDPKSALTVRLRASTLVRMGADARSVLEALAEKRFGQPKKAALVVRAAPPQRPVVRVAAPLMARPAFNPQPKPGAKKR